MVSNRKVVENIKGVVKDSTIESKRAIRYLGDIIDDRLNFQDHLEFVSRKSSVIQRMLVNISNIVKPHTLKRRIIVRVIMSIMLYTSPL